MADGSQKPGRRAINESLSKITKTIGKAQMVLVIAGLGGSVGTAAITPLVERLKKRKKAPLVVSVVVLPFVWEWTRSILAKKTVETLLVKSDSVIAVSNDKVHLSNPGAKMPQCLAMADGLLDLAVSSLTDLVYQPGEMNLDFADLRTALSAGDLGVMGFGEAKGPNRSIEAARTALNSPLMETKSLTGAKYFLIQLNAPKDLKASEFIALNEFLIKGLSPLAQVFLGLTYDENLRDSVKVIVIATGTLSDKKDPQVPKGP
ncbi:MAG: hypothetical protein LBF38_03590 [Deltaproteobacteria bacterium]|nr:hypothetical protein [Deltaproteobacteria bacterium]